MAGKTGEARKTELFDNEQKWLAASFSTDLKAFSIVINGKAKYGLAVSKLAFIKSLAMPDVKQYTRTEMRTKAANAMAEMVREKEGEAGK